MVEDWNVLPGETPFTDFDGLLLPAVRSRQALADAEGANIGKAVLEYLILESEPDDRRFRVGWCLDVHKSMFGDVWDWAGQVRLVELNYDRWSSPSRIMEDLGNLCEDLRYWEQHWPDVIEQATNLHHRAVKIHPFKNGNGRWARMLGNIWLRDHGVPIVNWPHEMTVVSPIRDEYLQAMRLADGGQYAALMSLHRQYSELSPL